jgi:hypothetical protein
MYRNAKEAVIKNAGSEPVSYHAAFHSHLESAAETFLAALALRGVRIERNTRCGLDCVIDLSL